MHKDLINALFLHDDKCWTREGSDKWFIPVLRQLLDHRKMKRSRTLR